MTCRVQSQNKNTIKYQKIYSSLPTNLDPMIFFINVKNFLIKSDIHSW